MVEDLEIRVFFFNILGGELYVLFLMVNDSFFGINQIYFVFGLVNLDGISYSINLGFNVIGFEDFFGGGDLDFDDIIVRFMLIQFRGIIGVS